MGAPSLGSVERKKLQAWMFFSREWVTQLDDLERRAQIWRGSKERAKNTKHEQEEGEEKKQKQGEINMRHVKKNRRDK